MKNKILEKALKLTESKRIDERTSPLPKATAFSLLFSYAGKDHKFVSKLTDIGGKLDRKKKEVYFDFTSAAARTKFRKKHKDIIKSLSESIEELDEASQRFGGDTNIPADKKTKGYIESGRAKILINVRSSLHPSARFVVAKNPNKGSNQDKVMMFTISDPDRGRIKMFSFHGTHVSHQKAMDFAKKHKLVAMKDAKGNPLYAKESYLDEVKTRSLTNPMKPAGKTEFAVAGVASGMFIKAFPTEKIARQYIKNQYSVLKKLKGKLGIIEVPLGANIVSNQMKRFGKIKVVKESVETDAKFDLAEALKMKKLGNKYRSGGGRVTSKGWGGSKEFNQQWNIEIDGTIIGRMMKVVHPENNYGDGDANWHLYVYEVGSRNKVAMDEWIVSADYGVEDPNDAWKKFVKSSKTSKGIIKAIEDHGVSISDLNKKHFKKSTKVVKEFVEEMDEKRDEPEVVFDFKSGRDAKQFAKDVENSGVGLANSGVERYKGKYRVVITGMTKDMHKKAIGKYAHKNKGEFSHSSSEVTPKGYGPYDESVTVNEETEWTLSIDFNRTMTDPELIALTKKFKKHYIGHGSDRFGGSDMGFEGPKSDLLKIKQYIEKVFKSQINKKNTFFAEA